MKSGFKKATGESSNDEQTEPIDKRRVTRHCIIFINYNSNKFLTNTWLCIVQLKISSYYPNYTREIRCIS